MTDSTRTLIKNLTDTFGHPVRSPILHPDLRSVHCGERS
jgi:hypothetical protein